MRPHLVRARPGPRRRGVGAAADAGRLQADRGRRRDHDRARPHVRRRAARREPRPAAARASTRCSPRRRAAPTRPGTTSRTGRRRRRPGPTATGRTSRTSTSGSARSPTSRTRSSSRSRSGSTRPRGYQTAWQVRLLPNVGAITCDTDDEDIPGWLDVIRPSGGRLTTDTVDDDGTDDPCELPPVAGYSGLENQTYRVEIHEGGAPGTATFKWSRDNGSVAIPVAGQGLDHRLCGSRRSARTTSCASRRATGSRSSTTRTSSGGSPARCARSPSTTRRARSPSPARCPPTCCRRTPTTRPTATCASGAGIRRASSRAAPARRSWTSTPRAPPALITVPATATTQVVLEHGVAVSFSVEGGGDVQAGRPLDLRGPHRGRVRRASWTRRLPTASTTTTRASAS